MATTSPNPPSLFDATEPEPEREPPAPREPDPRLQGLQTVAAAKAAADEERLARRLPKIERPEGFDHEDGIKSRDRVQSIEDFQALCDIGVFNATTMDSAVFAFRRFENASLHYAGGGREHEIYGGFDSYASAEDVVGAKV